MFRLQLLFVSKEPKPSIDKCVIFHKLISIDLAIDYTIHIVTRGTQGRVSKPRSSNSLSKLGSSFQQSTHKMFWSIHIFQTCPVYNSWLSQKQSTTFGLFQQMFWLILIYLSNMYKVYISWMLGFVATRQFHCFKWIHNITIPWHRS